MRHPTSNRARVGIASLALSAAALVGLAVSEGYSDQAIIPTKGDVPTVGFGLTVNPDGTRVKMGDRTNPVQALQRKLDYIQKDEAIIRRCVNVPLHQAEYDIYVDFAYNVGISGFCGSTIVKRLQAGDYRGACDAILMWRKAAGFDCSTPGNKRCWGLWQRRLDAHAACVAAQ
jgi:lysozyme